MAGLAAEWIKIPDGQGNLQKVWLRDSQARRDIAQLQTDVSGKAGAATTLAGYGITDAYTKTQVDGMIPSVPSAYTSNPAMDGTASPGSSTAWARGDHVHPHDSTKADVSAIPTKTSDLTNDSGFITSAPVTSVNGQTGAVSLTASDVGALPTGTTIPDPSSAAPVMDGTAAAGSSTDYARADHVHPSDTAKQDALSSSQLAAVNSGITANDLAVNNASVLCTVTPIVPTLSAGSHYSTYGGCWYYKIGCHVCVHIGVSGLTSKTQTTLWTMPAGYLPYSGIAVNGQSTTTANVARCRVTGTGEVRVHADGTNATCYMEYDAFA